MNPSNLPPGVLPRDIDRQMVQCDECGGSGVIWEGENYENEFKCPECDGTGEVRKDSV